MLTENQNNDSLVVNLDKVAAPDNGGDPGFSVPDLDDKIANLPNLDQPDVTQQNQNNSNIPNLDNEHQQTNQTSQQNDIFQSKYRDLIKKKYEDFGAEMPDDITEENFIDKIDELYASNVNRPKLHPEVEKFNEAVSKGVNPDEYIKTLQGINQVLEMPAEQLVRLSLKSNYGKSENRPAGWDDDKIESTIKKMEASGLLDVEAEKIKVSYQNEKQTAAQRMTEQAQARRNEQITQMNTLRDQSIKSSIEYFNKLDNINGIPVSQSDKHEFTEQFRYLVTPDENKGLSPLLEMLQSDETLVKVAYFLSKGDAKIKEQLTRAKESSKNDFLNKLDPEPKITQKRSGMQSTEVDFDALAAPAIN